MRHSTDVPTYNQEAVVSTGSRKLDGNPYPSDHAKIVIPSDAHISHSYIETNTYSKCGSDNE